VPTTRSIVPLALIVFLLSGGEAAAQSASPGDVVVSEFRTRGPSGGNDEFIELRNRSAEPVDISGWQLQGCASASPGNASTRATVGSDVLLPAGGSYLFANDASAGYSGIVPPGPDLDPVHMNSEFSSEQQSDHDPPLARFRMTGGDS
jgi:Lamin Tail Domain